MDFDAIVIGSGFGGAISAFRLADAGYRVLVLERGRRWAKNNYPRSPDDPWIWNSNCPERLNGWLDFRIFSRIAVAQGAGVGGGSLIYANISTEAPASAFQSPWPPEITYAELKPHYDSVARFMNVQRVPDGQWPERMKLMRDAAAGIGHLDRFQPLELAVSFDPNWSYQLPNAHHLSHSKEFTNEHGIKQGTCIHLGECDIGCPVWAKNTLDVNYIPRAEQKGAEIRPLHQAGCIEPITGGYRVFFDRFDRGRRLAGSTTGRIVIVAAGSLGSTELLLRCRDEHRSLPKLSRLLGKGWSSNGDFLTPALHLDRIVSPTRGPTINSAINFLDGSEGGESFWIEDGGFFNLLLACLGRLRSDLAESAHARTIIEAINLLLRGIPASDEHVMPWFAQGVDEPGGTMSLRRRWWLFGNSRLDLSWDARAAKRVVDTIVRMHERLAAAAGGKPFVPLAWTQLGYLITPHPLGGCNMGRSAHDGVVDHRGEVFGYRNLYVMDAATFPRAIGVNPSRTIGAIAERNTQILVSEGR